MSDLTWQSLALAPPRVVEPPAGTARMRVSPEDFQVDEELSFTAAGQGEHVLLRVRKREANTGWVARELAKIAGARHFDVGFAGLKDRHAVTTQWFTVPARHRPAAQWLEVRGEGFEVLEALPHNRKLPRGALAGNRFCIVLRDFVGDGVALERRVQRAAIEGVPNYFGPQRFGRNLGNLAVLEGASIGAQERSFVLSAARSLIFNAVLAVRVQDHSWNQLHVGERANLDGSNSSFAVEAIDAALKSRLAELDIHPSGPMWGPGASSVSGEIAALEEEISARYPPLLALLTEAAVEPARRPLRIAARDLQLRWLAAPDTVELRFALRAGSFATSVVRELLQLPSDQGDDDSA